MPPGAYTLEALRTCLGSIRRRRNLKSVPMILDRRSLWDAEALDAVLYYSSGPKQSWDNTEISGQWLSVMRNAMNGETRAYKHPNVLCVSVAHGTAQFAPYSDAMWEKYDLAKLAGENVTRNSFVAARRQRDITQRTSRTRVGTFQPEQIVSRYCSGVARCSWHVTMRCGRCAFD